MMSHFKAWTRLDWGTWALPLYVTHLSYAGNGMKNERVTGHVVSARVLCFGLFVEWSR